MNFLNTDNRLKVINIHSKPNEKLIKHYYDRRICPMNEEKLFITSG
jgi:hypothetical protein